MVETDIANCFEAIPHEKLMQAVEERVCDRSVLKLLRAMLRAGVMEDGQVRRPVTGTPQGGVVSPLMANVYLHRLDRAWDARLHGVLVRYADDAVVMCATREQAEAALPGWCTARAFSHGATAADIAVSKPALRTVSTSSTPRPARPLPAVADHQSATGLVTLPGDLQPDPVLGGAVQGKLRPPPTPTRLASTSRGAPGYRTRSFRRQLSAGRRAGEGLPSSRCHRRNVPCPIRRGVLHGCISRTFAASMAFALISGARHSLFPPRRTGL
ncbi:reverse transcriptase domain-containing protein [Streptomyces sp. WAC 01438]|uniref:reverse transcriptase domain-containing protein n=1 Tax=Streptomyces sp. WAC 01438 TaxID=2203204 RepID=UPI001F0C3262|nr:reverse transcriptase domain-containing protein [Streptomyces sp. WAC 01438]